MHGAYFAFSGGRAYTVFEQAVDAVRNGRDAGEFVVGERPDKPQWWMEHLKSDGAVGRIVMSL